MQKHVNKTVIFLSAIIIGLLVFPNTVSAVNDEWQEDFESETLGDDWVREISGNGTIAVTDDKSSEGDQSLKIWSPAPFQEKYTYGKVDVDPAYLVTTYQTSDYEIELDFRWEPYSWQMTMASTQWIYVVYNGQVDVYVNGSNEELIAQTASGPVSLCNDISPDEWHHIVFEADVSAGTYAVIVDENTVDSAVEFDDDSMNYYPGASDDSLLYIGDLDHTKTTPAGDNEDGYGEAYWDEMELYADFVHP